MVVVAAVVVAMVFALVTDQLELCWDSRACISIGHQDRQVAGTSNNV